MGATPPEEIAKQHKDAVALMDAGMECAPRINHGEVPLYWKERPTCPNPVVADGGTDDKTNTNGAKKSPLNGARKNVATSSSNALLPAENGNSDPSVEVNVTYPDWCISSRGQVDVSPIVALISEGVNDPAPPPPSPASKPHNGTKPKTNGKSPTNPPSFSLTNLWNEQNATQNNVRITRPSHDAWGIKKIILVFSDDFLHTIYTLPWYQPSPTDPNSIGSKLHRAIQPILQTLQIRQEQVVRCLLAGLPPGVTIPIHHDTGEWVKHTHRVHVPIIVPDPSRVLFRCGPTEQSMERIDCTPGHVFEMNNQAKHAVTNGHEKEFRVHLILDYVNEEFFEKRKKPMTTRVNLSPGEVLTQTRRSIDRAIEAGTRPQPSFLILGAQKSGTTSLYEYLNQHPWVIRPKRRETHCLDWRWDETLKSTEERRKRCLSFYYAASMKPYPSLQTGDSTPSYLLDYYRVIPRLKEVFEHEPRMIILTRDPIRRAVSHYAMVTSSDGTKEQMAARGMEWREKSFETVIDDDIKNMKEDGLLPYWDLETKTLDREIFDKFVDSPEEDAAWERYIRTRVPLNTGSYSPLARGMYALQCRQWFRSFSKDKFLVMKLEDMADEDKGEQWVLDRALEHLDLPKFEIPNLEKKNARIYDDPLEQNVRAWLESFFAPHNERFGKLLTSELGYEEDDWSNPWSYE